jgi:glyoxylate reductase
MSLIDGRAELVVGPPRGLVDREVYLECVAGADALVPMLTERIDREVLTRGVRLKIVANYAAGYNNVDIAAAEELGIWVTNTPDAVTQATAECTLGLLLAAARRIPESERCLREGKFEGWTPTHFIGTLLSGTTMGVVGMGRIGLAVARLAQAFGMRLIYTGPDPSPEAEALGAVRRGFEEFLRESDVVTIHCPLTPDTRHLFDAQALAKMKPTAILVNTARGPIVDEAALGDALQAGKLGAAGIDVYENEPKVHPRLLTAPRAVLVPHIGTSTLRTRVAMAEKALGDVMLVLQGKEPRHPVNHPKAPRPADERR